MCTYVSTAASNRFSTYLQIHPPTGTTGRPFLNFNSITQGRPSSVQLKHAGRSPIRDSSGVKLDKKPFLPHLQSLRNMAMYAEIVQVLTGKT